MKKILIIDHETSFMKYLKELLKDHNYKIINYKDIKFGDVRDFTHIILTGGQIDLDLDLCKEEVKIIKNSNKPILGICLGQQIISKMFGAELHKLDIHRKGPFTINVLKKDRIFEGLKDTLNIYEYHRYSMKNFDEHLVLLAESIDGAEIIKHKDKNIYGFQFHPEASEDGKILVENFLNLNA